MRRYIAVAVCFLILLVIGMAFGSFVHHRRSLVSFMVDIPAGSTVKIYADQGGDAPFQYDPAKPLFTLASDQTIKTKVGVYDFVIQNTDDYQTNVEKATVNKATTVVAVDPDFSTAKLEKELVKERPAILGALSAKFSNIDQYYTVTKVQIYNHGEWAGVILTPKSASYDPVRFVLHKNKGVWTVVNDPSILVIGSLYKNIPQNVVSSVNSL